MLGRVANLLVKELIQLVRDRMLLAVVLLIPVTQMSLLAQAASAGIRHLPTAVCDLDQSPESRALVTALRNSERFNPNVYVTNPEDLDILLDAGVVEASLLILPGFAEHLDRADSEAYVWFAVDGSNAITAGIALSHGEAIINRFLAEHTRRRGGREQPPLIEAEPRVWFNPDLRSENFYIPGEIGAILSFVIIALTAITIVRERELGTLEQLMVTPLRPIELIIGKAIPALLATYVELLGMVAIALTVFRVPIRGSLPLFLTLAAFYIAVEMGWGLLISTVASTQGQALMAAFFLDALDVILSGYLLPLEHMPELAQKISYLIPLRYYVIIARGIFLRGADFSMLWPEVLALCLLGIALYTLSALRLRSGMRT